MTATEMALEVVDVVVWSTLEAAYEDESLDDVLVVHQPALRARCGADWRLAAEEEAVDILRVAMSRLDLEKDGVDVLRHELRRNLGGATR